MSLAHKGKPPFPRLVPTVWRFHRPWNVTEHSSGWALPRLVTSLELSYGSVQRTSPLRLEASTAGRFSYYLHAVAVFT